jgi:hypothetical protein
VVVHDANTGSMQQPTSDGVWQAEAEVLGWDRVTGSHEVNLSGLTGLAPG